MSKSIITEFSTSLLELFAKLALGPIVAHVNERKGHVFTVEELAEVLKLPAPSQSFQVSQVGVRVGASSFVPSSFGAAPTPSTSSAPPSGKGGKRGPRSKKELTLAETCLYLSRGEGKRCTYAKERCAVNKNGKPMAGFCKTCSDKAAGLLQYSTYVSRGMSDDAIMELENPYDKTAFSSAKGSGGGRGKKNSTPTTSGSLAPVSGFPGRPVGRAVSVITSQQTSSDTGRQKTPSGIVYTLIDGKAICLGSTQSDFSTMVNSITPAQKEECDRNGYSLSSTVVISTTTSSEAGASHRSAPRKQMKEVDEDDVEEDDEVEED